MHQIIKGKVNIWRLLRMVLMINSGTCSSFVFVFWDCVYVSYNICIWMGSRQNMGWLSHFYRTWEVNVFTLLDSFYSDRSILHMGFICIGEILGYVEECNVIVWQCCNFFFYSSKNFIDSQMGGSLDDRPNLGIAQSLSYIR